VEGLEINSIECVSPSFRFIIKFYFKMKMTIRSYWY
jgi:hypothetical protein